MTKYQLVILCTYFKIKKSDHIMVLTFALHGVDIKIVFCYCSFASAPAALIELPYNTVGISVLPLGNIITIIQSKEASSIHF